MLIHEGASPYACAEVAASVVGVLAIVRDRTVQGMIVQVEAATLPVAAVVEWRWDLGPCRALALAFPLDLRDVNIDLRLGAEVAHELAGGVRRIGLPRSILLLSRRLP